MTERTSFELRAYLREKKRQPIAEFDHVIDLVDILLRLRVCAEDRFEKNRHLAYRKNKELPLEWTMIHDILHTPNNTPPERLITRIARNSMRDIESVVLDLRKLLARKREKVSLGMVQQVDSQCLRWLIRQPGRDAIEKAGSKQRILAVVRRENYNTLENRVFKDFLIRVTNLSQSYLSEYGHRFSEHDTIKSIRKLLLVCQEGLGLPMMDTVMGLQEIPVPNYVLRQERRYSTIWKMYCQVVRQAQLIEHLWDRRKEVEELIRRLTDTAPLHVNPCAKYYSQIWINDIKGNGDFLDQPFWKNELTNKKESTPVCKTETAVIDLTDRHVCRDLLIYSKHPNAKPYLQDYRTPSIEDINGEHYYLNDILAQENFAKLKDYFEQLYVILGGNRWIVLIPDHWDAQYQEKLIRSIPLHRSKVFLLWRSVAAVLGAESYLTSIANNDKIAVIDFQKEGSISVSCLHVATEKKSSRIVPKRKAYARNKGTYYHEINTYSMNQTLLDKKDQFIYGRQDNTGAYRSIDKALELAGPIKHIIAVGLCDDNIRRRINVQSVTGKNFYCEDDTRFLDTGADRYLKCKEQGIVSYYDELEELSIIVQTADERIVAKTLVEAKEEFPGGEVYVGQDVSDVWINELQDKNLLFYLCLGDKGPREPLRLLNQQLKYTPKEKQELTLRPRLIPGQGLAMVEVTSPFLRNPIVLDFLNMQSTSHTIYDLELQMPRSFPPQSPHVTADYNLWSIVKDKVNSYLTRKVRPDGCWFAQAVNIYSPFELLPSHASPLDRLRRKNVFGNEPGEQLPESNYDFDALFCKLAEDYERYRNNQDLQRQIIRLIAWTYQSNNPIFNKVKNDMLYKLSQYASSFGVPAPWPQEYSLCANLCVSKKDWQKCMQAIEERLENHSNRVREDLRLLYNLLQFHPYILYETEYYQKDKCWRLMRHLLFWYKQYRQDSQLIGYVLKCMLYLLRCRCFDGKLFLDTKKDGDRYHIVRQVLSAMQVATPKEELRNLVLKYLDGAGTIDGLPTD